MLRHDVAVLRRRVARPEPDGADGRSCLRDAGVGVVAAWRAFLDAQAKTILAATSSTSTPCPSDACVCCSS